MHGWQRSPTEDRKVLGALNRISLSLSRSLFFASFFLSPLYAFYHSVSIYLYLSLSVSIYLYLSLSVSICLYLSLSISFCLFLSLSISIYLFLSLSVSVCPYLSLSISFCLYLSLSISISFFPLSISISTSICLSINLSIFLKRRNYARLPSKVKVDRSKTKHFCESSSKNGR